MRKNVLLVILSSIVFFTLPLGLLKAPFSSVYASCTAGIPTCYYSCAAGWHLKNATCCSGGNQYISKTCVKDYEPKPTPTDKPNQPPPPAATNTPACSKKSQGDADCDGNITLKDYFYYVAKKAGATLPTTVNVDFDGDGKVNASDRAIIINSLKS